jgi:hypothetical protein
MRVNLKSRMDYNEFFLVRLICVMENCLIRPLQQTFRCSTRQFSRGPTIFGRPNSTASLISKVNLSWPDYLAIRRGRRKWQMVISNAVCPGQGPSINCVPLGCDDSLFYPWVCGWRRVFWNVRDRCYKTHYGMFKLAMRWLYSIHRGEL